MVEGCSCCSPYRQTFSPVNSLRTYATLYLGHLVGLAPLHQHAVSPSSYTAIVIHDAQQALNRQQTGSQMTGAKMLGLVVNRVEDMEWCNPDLIQSPPLSSVTPELVPYLRGYWLKNNGEILVVLDGRSIIAGMPQP